MADAAYRAKTGVNIGTMLITAPDNVKAAIDEIGAIRYGLVVITQCRLDKAVRAGGACCLRACAGGLFQLRFVISGGGPGCDGRAADGGLPRHARRMRVSGGGSR